jgi:hypothetical protein
VGVFDRVTITLAASALVGLGTLGYLVTAGGPPDPLAADLAAIGVALTLPGPATVVRRQPIDGPVRDGTYTLGVDRLHLRVAAGLAAGEGERLALESETLIFGLFEDHQAPYPGALSNTLQCGEGMRPQRVEGAARTLLTLFANDRYAFGGCADDLLRYHATVGAWLSPGGETLVRIEYFEPRAAGPERGLAAARSFTWAASP